MEPVEKNQAFATSTQSNLTTKVTDAWETEEDFSDKHSEAAVNNVLTAAATLCLVFSALSFVAINKTRNIPRTACFLSSSLIFFDSATTLTYATRKFVEDSHVLNIITVIGLGWSYASFVNVAIMAVERLIIFQWPYFYMRHVTYGACVKLLVVVMVVFLGAWTAEWISCFFTKTGFWNIRRCLDPIVIKYMTATFATLFLVILTCFIKIIIIISKQRNKVQPQSETSTRNHRSTIVVFLCCINYFLTALINIALVYTLAEITIVVRRTILDVLYMLNGLVDTCVYVLWYKECRYELLKLLACLVPPLKPKVEHMRVEIFDIMAHVQTTDSKDTVG